MKRDLYQIQLLVCLLCALVDIGQGQRSAAPPVLISQDIQAIGAVLTVIGTIVVCILVGIIIYCICHPRSQLTLDNRRREGRYYVHSEQDDMI